MLNASFFITVVGSIAALLIIFLLVYKSFYKKAPADSALVISGWTQKTGCLWRKPHQSNHQY